MVVIREQQRAWLMVRFFDKAGRLDAPVSVSYRIDCRTTKTAVRALTAVPPGAAVEIELTSTDNRILGGHDREERVVTVVANYGAEDQVADEFVYAVRNLQYLE